MSIHIIPISKLSAKALQGVIEEFVLREGTDYGTKEVSAETKFGQVKEKLERGLAVLVFDDEAETTNILLTDNPALRKIEASVEGEGQ